MERKRSNFPNEVYFKCQRCGKQAVLHEGDYIWYDEKKHIYLCDDCISIKEADDKWEYFLEQINADKYCNKCGRKIFDCEQRHVRTVEGKLIMHCLNCGPIKNKEKKEMPKRKQKENENIQNDEIPAFFKALNAKIAEENKDNVDHPSHYTDGKIEVIDFIEDKKLNYHRGNAIKYISRAGKKDKKKEIEDLQKAVWYLNREIERLKQAN